jgi:hypothetical protein
MSMKPALNLKAVEVAEGSEDKGVAAAEVVAEEVVAEEVVAAAEDRAVAAAARDAISQRHSHIRTVVMVSGI